MPTCAPHAPSALTPSKPPHSHFLTLEDSEQKAPSMWCHKTEVAGTCSPALLLCPCGSRRPLPSCGGCSHLWPGLPWHVAHTHLNTLQGSWSTQRPPQGLHLAEAPPPYFPIVSTFLTLPPLIASSFSPPTPPLSQWCLSPAPHRIGSYPALEPLGCCSLTWPFLALCVTLQCHLCWREEQHSYSLGTLLP